MKQNSASPFITVIIPVRETSYYLLFENLPAFVNQTHKKFEVIVLPNTHSQYDLTLLRQYKWLKIIPTGNITRPAEKRNIGVKNAKGEIVGFIDDDAYPDTIWLENAARLFRKDVAAICGPGILPKQTTIWERIFDEVLKTWIGSGGYSYRFKKDRARFVDDYPSMNFFVKRNLFNRIGGFRGDYWPGEDSKLCEEIVYKKKQKILYSPKIVTHHHRRNNLIGYLKQHANYGFHRGAFFAHGDRNSRRISYLMPTIFLVYLLSLIIYSIIQFNNLNNYFFIYLLPSIFYLLFSLYLFVRSLINTSNLAIAAGSVLVLFLTHVTYGIMFVKGFLKGKISKQDIYG